MWPISLIIEGRDGSTWWHVTHLKVSYFLADKSSPRADKWLWAWQSWLHPSAWSSVQAGALGAPLKAKKPLQQTFTASGDQDHRFPLWFFQELLSYQRKASIKCVTPLPLLFGELLSQEKLHFSFQTVEGRRMHRASLQCPGTSMLKQKISNGQVAKQIPWSFLCEEADPSFCFVLFFFNKNRSQRARWKPCCSFLSRHHLKL